MQCQLKSRHPSTTNSIQWSFRLANVTHTLLCIIVLQVFCWHTCACCIHVKSPYSDAVLSKSIHLSKSKIQAYKLVWELELSQWHKQYEKLILNAIISVQIKTSIPFILTNSIQWSFGLANVAHRIIITHYSAGFLLAYVHFEYTYYCPFQKYTFVQ